MSPTLTTEVSVEEVINVLAYLSSLAVIPKEALESALDMMLCDNGDWDIPYLVEQVINRSEVLNGQTITKVLTNIKDVTLGEPVPQHNWHSRLKNANVIKQALNAEKYLGTDPPIDPAKIPF
jgi:hypothetical protein